MPLPPSDPRFQVSAETGRWWLPLVFVLMIAAWYSYQLYKSTHQPPVFHNLENCPSDYYVGYDGAGNFICVPPPKGT